jgi:hypothetical protein
MVFLLSEDKALREKLQGMTVYDQKATGDDVPRNVGVWFGQPDQEIRAQAYPYVTIDMIDISRDPSREMRGLVSPSYLPTPTQVVLADGSTEQYDMNRHAVLINMPIPVNLDYQVTTYSRHPRHDRMLMAQLIRDKLSMRFGVLEIDDGTVRRMDVLDIMKRDITEQEKRLFVNAITVRVSSEIDPEIVDTLYQVRSVSLENPETLGFEGDWNRTAVISGTGNAAWGPTTA